MTISSIFAKVLWPTAGLSLAWRKFLYRQLCEGDKTPDFQFSTEFFGLKYEGNLNNNIEANILFYGAFEKPLLFFLRDCWIGLQKCQRFAPHPPTGDRRAATAVVAGISPFLLV